MPHPAPPTLPRADICERALDARDPRFDGIFFVGITTTGIYCRPICPARVSYTDRRRFFSSAAAAERAGFRPCLRCRPELAPGRAPVDAVSHLARATADRIGAGALNGRGVAGLAAELGVSERHLRRSLEREIGVSPHELAQTHRLLLAKRLLMDTALPVTRIAFTSGFQSLRRFNAVFRERYRLSPSELRGPGRDTRPGSPARPAGTSAPDLIRLTLAYRPPLAWDALLSTIGRHALPGAEVVCGSSYARTVSLDGRTGVVLADHPTRSRNGSGVTRHQIDLQVSTSLLPVLMPLLARFRRCLDLDAEPTVVDQHLAEGGLERLVTRRIGIRIPGSLDGFEAALSVLVGGSAAAATVVGALGDPIATDVPGLTRLVPTAARVAGAGESALAALGLTPVAARRLAAVARALAEGTIRLEVGEDGPAAVRALVGLGIDPSSATTIAMRALYWPDAFPPADPALQRAAGATGATGLDELADRWRPWRAYAAEHLRLALRDAARAKPGPTTSPARRARPARPVRRRHGHPAWAADAR